MAQDVIVSAAVPDNSPQGTVNLSVRVKGNGFKKGAIAKWLVTASETDTGGVTVNTTAYVSATELLANITVAPNAQTDKKFDIKVTLSSGRTGKGIELFSVRKGTTGCTAPTPILAAPWSCLLPGAAGCQDTTFGSNGLVITNTSGSTPTMTDIDIAKAVAVQSDGKLVVVGGSLIEGAPSGTSGFALVRYNPDGTLDPTFGGSGIVKLLHPTSPYPWAKAVAIQPDGKIVVAGDYSLVARYNPDGTLDSSFGSGGSTLITFPSSGRKGKPSQYVSAYFRDIAIQADSKILLVGNSDWAGWAIARLNPDGRLDAIFGNGGRVALESNGGRAYAVVLQPVQVGTTTEEWILVGGSAVAGASQQGDEDFAVMRFTPAGIIDSTFGPTGSGSVLTQFCTEQDRVSGLALDAVGNIVAGGFAKFNGTGNFAIARYSPNGVLDTSFGDPSSGTNQEGKTIVSLMAADSTGNDLLLQPDGKVIVTGTAEEASL
ncbi:MAG: hypothetical protein MUP80_08935, partial [Acidobacteriia bacterium]|nr:hypothetical protein [Terriglobia bacterium]